MSPLPIRLLPDSRLMYCSFLRSSSFTSSLLFNGDIRLDFFIMYIFHAVLSLLKFCIELSSFFIFVYVYIMFVH